MKRLLIVLCVLGVAGAANAATSTVDTSPFNTTYTLAAATDPYIPVNYTHTWTPDAGTLTGASLVIKASDVDDGGSNYGEDIHKVYLGSTSLGTLNYSQYYTGSTAGYSDTTTFNITDAALLGLLDGSTDFQIRLWATTQTSYYDYTSKLISSVLTLTYQAPPPVDPPVDPPVGVIPAPGAILLSSLGAGLVGWLRKRGTV